MKQTKWQRLATIGLCSSLVINAFAGVTAVAETVTSESSPTVANSITSPAFRQITELVKSQSRDGDPDFAAYYNLLGHRLDCGRMHRIFRDSEYRRLGLAMGVAHRRTAVAQRTSESII